MTEQEAREYIQQNINGLVHEENQHFSPDEDDNDLEYSVNLGDLIKETQDYFTFVGYPYSSEEPVDESVQFLYSINKHNKRIIHSTSPYTK